MPTRKVCISADYCRGNGVCPAKCRTTRASSSSRKVVLERWRSTLYWHDPKSRQAHAMIFINYRKADTQQVVDHLAGRLKDAFGNDRVFKDDKDLRAGERWPD